MMKRKDSAAQTAPAMPDRAFSMRRNRLVSAVIGKAFFMRRQREARGGGRGSFIRVHPGRRARRLVKKTEEDSFFRQGMIRKASAPGEEVPERKPGGVAAAG